MLYLFKEKKRTISALIFGAIFCLINLIARSLENNLGINAKQYVFIALNTIVLAPVIAEIYLRIEEWLTPDNKTIKLKKDQEIHKIQSDIKYYWICVLLLVISYFPVFLAYYPGLFAYDVSAQIPQYVSGYSKHHPLIHTLYLNFFYYVVGGKLFQSYTIGIAWAAVLQMILFAMMISYVHLFFRRINVNTIIRAGLIGLSAILPYFSVLSISMTKDTFFTGFVGVLAVSLFYWEIAPEHYKKGCNQIIYILSIVGTILFRNNGIYVVLLSTCVGIVFIVLIKKNFRYLWCTGIGIVLSLLVSFGMTTTLSAVNGSQNEMLSIPYQQLAYVYNTEYDNLTQEEKNQVIEFIPDVEKYNPHISDSIKESALGAQNKKSLLKCYFQFLGKYPMEFIEAFLAHNAGYFYIEDTSHAAIYGASLEKRSGYLLTDTKEGFDVEHHSYFKALENLYEDLYSANEYQNFYLLKFLCSPAVYFWTIILLCFYGIDLKRFYPVQFAFVFGLIITLLAGPCVLIRYAFPYIICLPILAASVLKDTSERKGYSKWIR